MDKVWVVVRFEGEQVRTFNVYSDERVARLVAQEWAEVREVQVLHLEISHMTPPQWLDEAQTMAEQDARARVRAKYHRVMQGEHHG